MKTFGGDARGSSFTSTDRGRYVLTQAKAHGGQEVPPRLDAGAII